MIDAAKINLAVPAVSERRPDDTPAPARSRTVSDGENPASEQTRVSAGERGDRFVASAAPVATALYAVSDIQRNGGMTSIRPDPLRRVTVNGEEVTRKLADIPLAVNRKHLEIYQTEE